MVPHVRSLLQAPVVKEILEAIVLLGQVLHFEGGEGVQEGQVVAIWVDELGFAQVSFVLLLFGSHENVGYTQHRH